MLQLYKYQQIIDSSTYQVTLPPVVGRKGKQPGCPTNKHQADEQIASNARRLVYYTTPVDADAPSHCLWNPQETAAMPITECTNLESHGLKFSKPNAHYMCTYFICATDEQSLHIIHTTLQQLVMQSAQFCPFTCINTLYILEISKYQCSLLTVWVTFG